MTGIEAISGFGFGVGDPVITRLGGAAMGAAAPAGQAAFSELLAAGMRQVDTKVSAANDLVQRFAVDDTVPLHQVTYALEEARLAVELAMQVRTRLVESYREVMNMQL